jgi:2-haloacid dehalogenase
LKITHLTFDCYGTLIDWETGILRALQPLFAKATPTDILRLYVKHEARLESGAWRLYSQILREVTSSIAQEMGVALAESKRNVLTETIGNWPPFSDTVAALQQLKQRYRLVILSNVDDALFAGTAKRLQVPFDEIITAEQVRSYKPGEEHFREALRRLKVPPSQILHVAQSLYHDHVPAKRLGFQTARVNRPSQLEMTGLAPAVTADPDLEFPDLQTLAAKLVFQ